MKLWNFCQALRKTSGLALLLALIPIASRGETKKLNLPSQCTTGGCELILNGTAVRSVLGFQVYFAGLYLTENQRDEKHIMCRDPGGKRVHITMLRPVAGKKFESTIQKNIGKNFSEQERRRFASELDEFLGCFGNGSTLGKGDVIKIDYLPEEGTIVTVNDSVHDTIPGHDFYHALLRLWIGIPPQKTVKDGLLGKTS